MRPHSAPKKPIPATKAAIASNRAIVRSLCSIVSRPGRRPTSPDFKPLQCRLCYAEAVATAQTSRPERVAGAALCPGLALKCFRHPKILLVHPLAWLLMLDTLECLDDFAFLLPPFDSVRIGKRTLFSFMMCCRRRPRSPARSAQPPLWRRRRPPQRPGFLAGGQVSCPSSGAASTWWAGLQSSQSNRFSR